MYIQDAHNIISLPRPDEPHRQEAINVMTSNTKYSPAEQKDSSRIDCDHEIKSCDQLHIFENVHLLVHEIMPETETREKINEVYIRVQKHLFYESYADDFGPLNLASVYRFCETLDWHLENNPVHNIIVCSSDDIKALTNSVFLAKCHIHVISMSYLFFKKDILDVPGIS